MNRLASLLATGFGIGRIPGAPGTAAALSVLPLGWAIALFAGPPGLLFTAISASVLGFWACGAYARSTAKKDPGECVWDEIAGQLIAMLPIAAAGDASDLPPVALAFLLFRLFDIAKPWPISRLERIPGGLGIMADDIAAGLAAAFILAAAMHWNWI